MITPPATPEERAGEPRGRGGPGEQHGALRGREEVVADRRGVAVPHCRERRRSRRLGEVVPAPGNFYVNLPPLFLGHFSPIFARFFPVFSPFSPSCRQDSGNRHQDPEKRSETVEKRRVKTAIWVSLLRGVGTIAGAWSPAHCPQSR